MKIKKVELFGGKMSRNYTIELPNGKEVIVNKWNEEWLEDGYFDADISIQKGEKELNEWINEKGDEFCDQRQDDFDDFMNDINVWDKEDKKPKTSFKITALHRDDLESRGFITDDVSDEVMERLASKMGDAHCDGSYWIDRDILAEEVFEIPKRTQEQMDRKLAKEMLKNKFKCEECGHLFTEEQIMYYVSDADDNQNCPKCNYLIT